MGTLRIIAGTLKGRRIQVPDGLAVRPTANKVREALFDILGPLLAGMDVLDAYAGSGALGLEALSRGARTLTFLEADRNAAQYLRRNLKAMALESRSRLVTLPVVTALTRRRGSMGPFDLVLADPPYRMDAAAELLVALSSQGALRPGARIVVEREASTPALVDLASGFRLSRTTRYGRTCLDFYLFN